VKIKHEGLHRRRFAGNPVEKLFAAEWEKQNKLHHTLAYLLHGQERLRHGDLDPREAEIAATVIQWLGSPVGMCFLRDVVQQSEVLKQNLAMEYPQVDSRRKSEAKSKLLKIMAALED
jgi:hypothetical protein